ncbi:PalH/RIM21-domain-containing protein [Ilyonectria destructans]|nr:PalH/RIM21-domain-containing protein [Ilyonectria destructans]
MDANQLVTATLTAALPALCTTTIWPGAGVMTWGPDGAQVPVVDPIIYQAPCATGLIPRADSSLTVASDSSLTQHDSSDSSVKFSDFRDPFYASTFPICYALAATTVTAYMLVIMLFVTPRSFLDGGIVYLGRRGGFTHSSGTGISIGGRPWLQKVAALTVAMSLTVASVDTFNVAQNQYTWGIQNAKELQDEIMGSTELKVIRLVSDTFLWLAQAQTLIRLFPRQREKIIIKWVAFALIILDLIFSALNSFKYSENGINSTVRPKNFVHPVPALSYLFQLALGVLYAAWVLYYAIMKKRYAFYHPFMKNIFLVSIISIMSIVIPIVFFILDISKPDFTGWGDYVRWVGAAAASVVVWEWVERIEALEREEKKDGILGREVFDGDDMLEVDASEFPWLRNRKNRKGGGSGGGGTGERQQASTSMANGWVNMSAITNRYRGMSNDAHETTAAVSTQRSMGTILRPPIWPARPAPAVTPVSRTDTASAASTVYAVRYQPPSEATTRTPDPLPQQSAVDLARPNSNPQPHPNNDDTSPWTQASTSPQNGHAVAPASGHTADLEANSATQSQGGWRSLTFANPIFRNSSEEATSEVPQNQPSPTPEPRSTGRWDLRARLEDFAANQADKLRDRMRTAPNTETLHTTVIPAPARRGAALQQVLEEEELITSHNSPSIGLGANSNSSSSREASGEMAQLDRSRSTFSGSQQGEPAIPPNNPPLWRGVQSRMIYEDGYYSDDDVRSVSETSSVDHRRQDSDSSRQSRVP